MVNLSPKETSNSETDLGYPFYVKDIAGKALTLKLCFSVT